jgi:Mce-associated membrane protein
MTEDKTDDVTDTEGLADEAATVDAKVRTRRFGRRTKSQPPGRGRRLLPVAVLALLLLGSAGLASWLYFYQVRPDQETNGAAAAQTVKAANDGAVALLSYAPGTMDQDFAAAKSHLTGGFLDYYSQFTHDIVAPAVQQKAVKTSAVIVQSAVSELHPDSATVLVFLNQTTTSKENPNGSFTASSVKVGLTKVNGSWLISAFDPV